MSINAKDFLTQIIKWPNVYSFLLEQGYTPDPENQELKSKKCLVDNDTMVMCMYIYMKKNLSPNEDQYTVGSLAHTMVGNGYNARKACEGKIKRALTAIAGYQIVDFYRDQHIGKRECIRIEATELLVDFMEDNFFNLDDEELSPVLKHAA